MRRWVEPLAEAEYLRLRFLTRPELTVYLQGCLAQPGRIGWLDDLIVEELHDDEDPYGYGITFRTARLTLDGRCFGLTPR